MFWVPNIPQQTHLATAMIRIMSSGKITKDHGNENTFELFHEYLVNLLVVIKVNKTEKNSLKDHEAN